MNRYTNITNTSKFGKRRVIPEFEATSAVQFNTLQVTSINGVPVIDTEKVNEQQTLDIDTSKQDIKDLQSRVIYLESSVYKLQQIIFHLTAQ